MKITISASDAVVLLAHLRQTLLRADTTERRAVLSGVAETIQAAIDIDVEDMRR